MLEGYNKGCFTELDFHGQQNHTLQIVYWLVSKGRALT
jgi:hypothetical protein